MKTVKLGPFLGLNNRLPAATLDTENGRFLADALNVDITNSGTIVRRAAAELVQPMADTHSLFVTGPGGYFVRGSVLYSFVLSPYSETFVKALTTSDPVTYVKFAGSLYLSNGTDIGRVADGAYFPVGLPTPDQPTVAQSVGALAKGKYQVAVSYTNATTGEEGGVSASANITLTGDAALTVALPGVVVGATHVNVYISTVNGSIPMLHSSVAIGTTELSVNTKATGREASSRFESPLPAGKLFLYNGMLCSYKGSDVHRGIPYRPGYRLSTESRIPFPQEVSNVIPAQNGIYVTSDQTYWLAGQDLADVQMIQDVLPYGAVSGTGFNLPDKATVGWMGERGFVLADVNGQVTEASANAVDMTLPEESCAVVLTEGGYRRVVSCGYAMNLENSAVTRYDDTYLDFNSMSCGYALNANGLYKLVGAGDVSAIVNLGLVNFGAEERKRMPAAYLGVESQTPMELRVVTPEHDYTYRSRSSSEDLRVQRVDTGKGLIANWFELQVYNTEGADFSLVSVSFAPALSTRRI